MVSSHFLSSNTQVPRLFPKNLKNLKLDLVGHMQLWCDALLVKLPSQWEQGGGE